MTISKSKKSRRWCDWRKWLIAGSVLLVSLLALGYFLKTKDDFSKQRSPKKQMVSQRQLVSRKQQAPKKQPASEVTSEDQLTQESQTPVQESQTPIRLKNFDWQMFYQGIESAQESSRLESKSRSVKGLIVPHHLLAAKIIAEGYAQLPEDKIKNVILIGPNHKEKGERDLLSSLAAWQTPLGLLEVNQKMVRELVEHDLVDINREVIAADHSMGTHIPFIQTYLPEAQVVPIVLKKNADRQERWALTKALVDYLKLDDTILIASIDFSHYLSSDEAQVNDCETRQVMTERDYPKIESWGSEHLDSPASLLVILEAMKRIGKDDFEILENTNSAILTKQDSLETTSYFSVIF